MIKTCALDGCTNTWEYDGTRRKFCCQDHAIYHRNHTPKAVAARDEYNRGWQARNRDKVLGYQRAWRARKRAQMENR